MILIAGISTKIKRLDDNPQRCPHCGLSQAYNTRVDHYFNLFFIPVFRVKKGEPFVMCDRCQNTAHQFTRSGDADPHAREHRCKNCGQLSQKEFKYCPFCGKVL